MRFVQFLFFRHTLVQRILSNCYIDLSDFSSAALSSIAVATGVVKFNQLSASYIPLQYAFGYTA